jgi:two-component system, NarL family, response regulator DesR
VIRILLGQSGTLVREALATVLSQEEDFAVVARVGQREDVVALASSERADVAVLDWALPGTVPWTDLCVTLHTVAPECGVLVMLDPSSSAGAGTDLARLSPRVGLIAVDSSPADLIDGVRQLVRGEPVFDAEVAVAALTAEANPLTDRERDVLRLAQGGAPAKEIAKRLYLSTGTVRNYLSRIVTKTGARTHLEAIRRAEDAGWI